MVNFYKKTALACAASCGHRGSLRIAPIDRTFADIGHRAVCRSSARGGWTAGHSGQRGGSSSSYRTASRAALRGGCDLQLLRLGCES